MLTRIAGVADNDHVYRRPVDPAHIGLLQVCNQEEYA